MDIITLLVVLQYTINKTIPTYFKPKHLYRLLKIPYALTIPPFANNQEATSNLKEMDQLFPEVMDNLKNIPPYQEIPEMIDHLKRVRATFFVMFYNACILGFRPLSI